MANYTKSTNFAVKDGLPSGDPLKVVKGTEIDTEFNNIATAVTSKADLSGPTFLGTPFAPTASAGTNTNQIATTAFTVTAVANERTATATLTNKTLTSPVISSIVNTGTLTLPTATDTVVGRATTDTLTNKTVSLGSNTVSGTKAQFNTAVTDTDFLFQNDLTGSNQQLSQSGYQKLPGGLIIQWGRNNPGGTVTFPIAFPTACFAVSATAGSNFEEFVNTITASSFFLGTNGNSAPCPWIAVGH